MSLVWVEFRNGLPYRIYHNAKQAAIAHVNGIKLTEMEYKDAIGSIREQAWIRDGKRCVDCGRELPLTGSLYQRVHFAHTVSKGRCGEDCVDNGLSKCYDCHIEKDHKGGKVVPAKERN